MSQTYETTIAEGGVTVEKPRVTVEYRGQIPLKWTCQNYVQGKDLKISLVPGETDKFDYDYARRVFGDWEVNPDASPQKRIEWNGMIAHTKMKSPSKDGKLPNVRIYDPEGVLLWDAAVQMEAWLEHNAGSREAFAIPADSPMGMVEMPTILKDATDEQLKVLWLESWGSKMPGNIKRDIVRNSLMPRMTESQISDVLAKEFTAATVE